MALTLAGVALAGQPWACKSKPAGEKRESNVAGSGAQPAPLAAPMAAPHTAELGPLSVGQWTRYELNDRGRTSLVTHKVVGVQSEAFWLEFVTGAADAGTVLGLLVHAPDRTQASRAEIRAARIRMPNGLTKEIRGAELKPTEAAYKRMVDDLFRTSLRGSPQSDVTTPAGTFRGCYRQNTKLGFSGDNAEMSVWIHPGVPLSGVVKAETTDRAWTVQLLAFGTEGAESELTPKPAR